MTVATWILAVSTALLAFEGGTAVLKWTDRLKPGKTRRELAELRKQVELLHLAAWMDVTRTNQGNIPAEIDDRVRSLLMSDGWQPDMAAAERAGYFSLSRLRGGI